MLKPHGFCLSTLSILGLVFTCSTALSQSSRAGKMTVCSMTFNSSDEIETMKTRLIKEMGKENLQFVEVLNYLGKEEDGFVRNSDKWLPRACQGLKNANKKCDILVISGHYGGAFFGDKISVGMSLENMEEASCQTDCSNLFQSPKEVYLFGCNTLAGKEPDRRTIQEYIQALMEHDMSESEARRTALFRYSNFGDSNRNRMARVFPRSHFIYGFNSIAPLGADIAPHIHSFFNSIVSYKQNLNQSLTSGNNPKLTSAMTGTAFTTVQGRNIQNQLSDRFQNLTCGISSAQASAIQEYVILARQGQFVELFPMILDMTWRNNSSQILSPLASLSQTTGFKDYVMSLGKFFNTDIGMNLRLLRYAYISKWVTEEEMQDRYHMLHLQAFRQSEIDDEVIQAFGEFKPSLKISNGVDFYNRIKTNWARSHSGHANLIARTAPASMDLLNLFGRSNNHQAASLLVAQNPSFFKNVILKSLPQNSYEKSARGFSLTSLFPAIVSSLSASELRRAFGSLVDYETAFAVAEEIAQQSNLTRENYLGIIGMIKDPNFVYRDEVTAAISATVINFKDVNEEEILNDLLAVYRSQRGQRSMLAINVGITLVELGYRPRDMKDFFMSLRNDPDAGESARYILNSYF